MADIFFDASGLVPLINPADHWRPNLDRIMGGLTRAGKPGFVTSNWTLYEALAIVRRRAGYELTRRLAELVERQFYVAPVRADLEKIAYTRFLAWKDKEASVVDHANLLVAEAVGCEAIVTFDEDFLPIARGTGIRLLG